MKNKLTKFEDLKGHILTGIAIDGDRCFVGNEWTGSTERITFSLQNGKKYKLYHLQECCESCYLVEIVGSLADLIGLPLLSAEEVIYDQNETPAGILVQRYMSRSTWTFYKLSTGRGYVTLRWCGESNGYYSETVDFKEVCENEK